MQQTSLFPDVIQKRHVKLSNENLVKNSSLGLPDVKINEMHAQKSFRNSRKPQEWLDNSPPEDIEMIYKSCEYHLNDILSEIENIEIKFNINDKNMHHTLTKYAKQLNQIRDAASYYDIKSSRSLRDVIAQTTTSIRAMAISEKQKEKREKIILVEVDSRPQSSAFSDKILPTKQPLPQKNISINEYNENLKLTKFILDKTSDALSDRYPSIIQQIEEILSIFEKYLLSFSNISAFERLNSLRNSMNLSGSSKMNKKTSAKNHLEAVYRYDTKCKDIAKFIRKIIKNLKSLAEKFDNPQSNGVSLSILAKEIQELAIRCDGSSLPILFIVPEYNFQLKRCVESLKDWIKHDKSYKEFIHIDLKTVEKSRNSLKNLLLDTQQAFNQIEYKTKLMRQELEKREIELQHWYEKKEQDYLWEEEELQDRMLSKQLQKEVLENELVKMKKTPDLYMDFRCTVDRLTSDLKAIDTELPRLAKNINVCKNKIDYVKEKKKKYVELRSMVEKFENETRKLSDQKYQYEMDYEKLDSCYCILKEIYLYKKSSETLRKIYHNIPFKSLARRQGIQFNSSSVLADISMNSSFTNKTKEKLDEKLDRAIKLASKMIESDWSKLYFVLPFVPHRGNETIQHDVDKISDNFNRGGDNKEKAQAALHKWCRLHIRSRVDDLLVALESINRKDIREAIEKSLVNQETKKKKEVQSDDEEQYKDPHKREIDTLNKKISSFLDKVKNGQMPMKKTYEYVSIGTLISEIDKDRNRIKV